MWNTEPTITNDYFTNSNHKPLVFITLFFRIVTHKTIERALLAQSNECTRYMFKSALFMALAGPLGLICPTMALGIYCQYTRFTKVRLKMI